jgi:hypothetical protein
MATKLTAPVTREGTRLIRPDGGGKQRPLMFTLLPGDVLQIREKGMKRAPIELSLVSLYERGVLTRARNAQ